MLSGNTGVYYLHLFPGNRTRSLTEGQSLLQQGKGFLSLLSILLVMPSPTHPSFSICTVHYLAEPPSPLTRTTLLTSIFAHQPYQQTPPNNGYFTLQPEVLFHHRDHIPLLWLPIILWVKPQIINMVFKTYHTFLPFAFQSPTIQGFWFSNVPGYVTLAFLQMPHTHCSLWLPCHIHHHTWLSSTHPITTKYGRCHVQPVNMCRAHTMHHIVLSRYGGIRI